jgi:hypothetical protein
MNNLPVPPEYIPEGGVLLPHGHAYQDAYELPISMLPGAAPPASEDGDDQPRIAAVRLSELWEITPEEVRAMAGNGWRFWIRWSMVQGQIRLMKLEPLIPLARPHLFLNSDVQDTPPHP